MDMLFFWLGLIVFIIGGLGFLIATFRAGILWGFSCLILPPVSLIFLFAHWDKAKGPFGLQLIGLGGLLFGTYQAGLFESQLGVQQFNRQVQTLTPSTTAQQAIPSSRFSCDGRQYCSQMTSLAEARFFTRNCPNTKMDGDGDGEPCENDSRWR